MGANQTSSEGSTTYSENPITIKSFDGETVTFSLTQEWTVDCSVDWIATTYSIADGTTRCDKENVVVPQGTFTYTATCVEGWARASVYVYDNNFNTTDDPKVPAFCGEDVNVVGNKVAYNFSIPCECDEGELPQLDASPSPAPTSNCEYYDISFDEKDIPAGLYVSTQWKEYGLRLSGEEVRDGSGGFMPNGYPRLFDTSAPVNGDGYGTLGLSGDIGNVLVVQQTGGNAQWKANEAGGTLVFDFLSPVEEVLEVGLMNVVGEAWIQATDADGATRTFVVEPSASEPLPVQQQVVIDVPLVSKLVVKLFGPSAVTHISICSDFANTPTSESWPTDLPSSVPSKQEPGTKHCAKYQRCSVIVA